MLNNESILASTQSPQSTFFGKILGSFESGIDRITTEILPNWVGNQLGLQSQDQLQDSTFNPAYAGQRIDGKTIPANQVQPPFLQRVLFDVGSVQVTGGALLMMGLVGTGAVIVFKKVL